MVLDILNYNDLKRPNSKKYFNKKSYINKILIRLFTPLLITKSFGLQPTLTSYVITIALWRNISSISVFSDFAKRNATLSTSKKYLKQ
jgi:hypothetical protein